MSVVAFSRAAQHYDAVASLQQSLVHALAEELPVIAHQQVLDAGCGTGFFAQWCASHRKEWRVFGADAAFGMCRAARGSVMQADMQSLPIAAASMDGVFCASSLQWVSDWQCTFDEFYRVLKPGGWLAASVFVQGTLQELERAFSAVDGYSHLLAFRPPEALSDAARGAGFDVISCHHCSHAKRVESVSALMRQLKAMGANGKSGAVRKAMMTPRQLAQLEKSYRAAAPTMKARWSIATLMAHKENV